MLIKLLPAILLGACVGNEFETDRMVDDLHVSMGIALPLLKTSITMGDILSDETDQVKYYRDAADNERIMLYHYKDSVEQMGLDDFFKISVDAVDVPVPFDVFREQEEFAVPAEVQFNVPDATLSKLELSYDLSLTGSNLAAPLLVTFAFPTANTTNGKGGKTLSFKVYNNQTSTQASVKDLFKIKDGKLPVTISIKLLNGGADYSFGKEGNLAVNMGNISLSYAKGSMRENAVQLDEGKYALDFDALEDVPGDVEFNDPKLTIRLNNATPFEALINADMKGELDGKPSVNLNAPPITLPACPVDKDSIVYNYILDKTNSNLKELVSEKPQNLIYGGSLTLNPGGTNTNEVELYADDRIYIGYGIEIPLDLKLNANIDVDTINLAQSDAIKNLEKATLVFSSDNGFPLAATVSLYFYDQDADAVIETIDLALLESAIIDETFGIVKEKVKNAENIVLSDEQIKKLNASEELRIRIHLQTGNYDKGRSVVFLKDNAMDIQLSIKGKIKQ